MKPRAVVYPATLALLMAACDASAPTATNVKSAPSTINPAAIVYMTNEQDVQLNSVHTNPCNLDEITVTSGSHFIVMTGPPFDLDPVRKLLEIARSPAETI